MTGTPRDRTDGVASQKSIGEEINDVKTVQRGWHAATPAAAVEAVPSQSEAAHESPQMQQEHESAHLSSPVSHDSAEGARHAEGDDGAESMWGLQAEQIAPGATQSHAGSYLSLSAARDINDILAHIDFEIDWLTPSEFPCSVPLEACPNADELFIKIDEQIPPWLQGRSVEALRVEHFNAQPGQRNLSCRIVRDSDAGVATYRTLLSRLHNLRGDAYPEFRVTIEWF